MNNAPPGSFGTQQCWGEHSSEYFNFVVKYCLVSLNNGLFSSMTKCQKKYGTFFLGGIEKKNVFFELRRILLAAINKLFLSLSLGFDRDVSHLR